MKSRFILGIFAVITAGLLTMPAMAAFSDVTSSTNYSEAILYAQSNHIVDGYPDGTFRPNQTVNRAEFTKILIEAQFALNYKTTNIPDTSRCFNDSIGGLWYERYTCYAKMNNIISGYPDGSFRPGVEINFVEAAKIIVNGFGYTTDSNAIWYKPFVDQLAQLKAIPVSITTFDQKITRGQMVEMMYRLREDLMDRPSTDYQQISGEVSVVIPPPIEDEAPPAAPTSLTPMIGSCTIFPSNNPWNTDISEYAVDPMSSDYIANISRTQTLHPDFGGNGEYGIPYNVVGAGQAKVPLLSVQYADESDPGPYPIPDDAKIENGSDAHVIVVDRDNCKLYELFAAEKATGGWNAGSAAIFDLLSNELRPDGWTSADAAGLPIFAGLVRYDEVAAGAVNHAIRFTARETQKGYIHPATHFAARTTDASFPPMGLRVRLKADYDISGLTGHALVIATAMKKYGMILADNGSNWYFTGAADPRWDDEDLNQLKTIPGSAFEAVKTGDVQR